MQTPSPTPQPHWLRHYASPNYTWTATSIDATNPDSRTRFSRPLGLVESIFDSDGRFWEGRADINCLLTLEIRSSLSPVELRKHILLAWTCLRCQHLLLQARAVVSAEERSEGKSKSHDVRFIVDLPATTTDARVEAEKHIVFLADHYDTITWQDFWLHCQNAARVLDPNLALAKLFLLTPEIKKGSETFTLHFLAIGAHQIWDGLATSIWMRNFTQFLNESHVQLTQRLTASLEPKGVRARLPPPQEALYPPFLPTATSRAKQRWFWLLTRLLRHVRKPLAAGFPNPLYRSQRQPPIPLSPVYDRVLNYTTTPALNTTVINITLPTHQTRTLHRLCREAGTSVGAGCFALVAMSMMALYESLNPNIPLAERRPFITGFPLNPRAFFDHKVEPDSCMLAFSDGISLPFLSASLPVEGRLRLLAKVAQRQLGVYQKRRTARQEQDLSSMTSRGAGRVLAVQYLNSIERADAMVPGRLRKYPNPQGQYPASQNLTGQTCGVSSVGRRDPLLRPGVYDVRRPACEEGKEMVADFRSMRQCVRAREGEFLVGIGGDEEAVGVGVSVDASVVDLGRVEEWRGMLLGLLEGVGGEGREGRERSRL
ncbi:hypothetical protein LTR78_004630 [Recurvomyces mirabilis]|uniref:Uncharacterized protein n=1 Tax=Recurvomyces mirabilis TaxID=574656 RepID=A0AAE1C2C1_9PEZI|nr:hypothetical protein LTR78_004630 [Recurvomyces mirabilis]KAK5152877.1 hypothetical protein LTS14_007984 [Recurvomyces mirabilis]